MFALVNFFLEVDFVTIYVTDINILTLAKHTLRAP